MSASALGPDPHSYSNFHEISTEHLSINLTVDFTRRVVFGYTDYTVQVHVANTSRILLDFRGVSIEKVTLLSPNKETILPYTIPHYHKNLGHCLQVSIPTDLQHKSSKFVFRVYSSSTDLSGGIQWFEPEQTLGKQYPFMYTQFEAILARTMIPCQDTPSVKAPYDIRVTVPAPLVAACSGALVETKESTKNVFPFPQALKYFTYHFQQKIPIPAYLIAVAVGALQRGQIGPRSFVWCEKELMQACQHEWSDTEKYLQAGEKICGIPYEWGTYDLLMLPGAFPYGGMENPNLTFLNSCLISGDKSLADVVAHEITHSWAGNLVTNANWNDFWLNEGFTMYIERLILGECNGEEHRHFCLASGYALLKKTCIELNDEPEFTRLNQNLAGIDPDDAFSRIPYEKGCLFLFHLEALVGGKEKMVQWLQSYFKHFYKKSLTWEDMANHFKSHFTNVEVDWETWMHGQGLPKWDPVPYFKEGISKKVNDLAELWLGKQGENAKAEDLQWNAEETMLFLDIIINSGKKLTKEIICKMDTLYKLSGCRNVEVAFRWILICLENNYLEIMETTEKFLEKNGRGVYVKPIYKRLVQMDCEGTLTKGKVKEIYEKNKGFYHSVVKSYAEGLLKY